MSVLSDYYAKKAAGQPVTQDEIKAAQEALVQERNNYIATHPGTSVADASMAVMAANGSPYVNNSNGSYSYVPLGTNNPSTWTGNANTTGTTSTSGTTGGTSGTGGIVPPSTPGNADGDRAWGTRNGQPVQFTWRNGQWTLDNYDNTSNTAGADAMRDLLGTGGNTGDSSIDMWTADPEQAYLDKFGIGTTGQGLYAKWLASQYNPTRANFLAYTALNPSTNGQERTFGDYLNQYGVNGARNQGLSLFNQAQGLSPNNDYEFWNETLGDYGNDFMANVLRQKYSAPVGYSMAQNYAPIQKAFNAHEGLYAGTEGYNGSFLDYLRGKYGL
jgi:hypothetical protein